jgi:effector-binding domain-containing protein
VHDLAQLDEFERALDGHRRLRGQCSMSYDIELVNVLEQPAAVVRARVEHNGIAEFLGPAFGDVMTALQRQGLQPAGPPFGRYRPTEDGGWDITAGFPVGDTVAAEGRVEALTLPGGPVARTLHVGDYGSLAMAYEAVSAWLGDHGWTAAGEPWECYLDEPEVVPPRTEIWFPCRQESNAGTQHPG